MMRFLHDPYALLIKVVYKNFPKKKKEFDKIIVQWIPNLAEDQNCYGAAYFDRECRPIKIDLDANLSVPQAVEVFIHELAHVIVGPKEKHNKIFKSMCKFIMKKYSEEVHALAKRRKARVVEMKKSKNK